MLRRQHRHIGRREGQSGARQVTCQVHLTPQLESVHGLLNAFALRAVANDQQARSGKLPHDQSERLQQQAMILFRPELGNDTKHQGVVGKSEP